MSAYRSTLVDPQLLSVGERSRGVKYLHEVSGSRQAEILAGKPAPEPPLDRLGESLKKYVEAVG